MEIVEEHRRVAHMLRELGHVSTEGILVGREPSGSKIYKVVRHYRSAEAPFCWSSVRPVGKVEHVAHPNVLMHGKDPSDAIRMASATTSERPKGNVMEDFYPARRCPPTSPDDGKHTSPRPTTVLTVLGCC